MKLLPQDNLPHQFSSAATCRGLHAQPNQGVRNRRHTLRLARQTSSPCRCQSLPEGSGKPLANLRAWGAELFNSLRTGWSDQPKQKAQPGAPKQAPQQQSSDSSSGEAAALESSSAAAAAAAEEQMIKDAQDPSQYVVLADVSGDESDGQEEEDPPEEGTWEHWEEHFAEMDRLYEAACEVESAIEDSIGAEQYAEATRLRGAYAEIQERDDVNTVLKDLQEALQREDYAGAARLRDGGCAGLVGWWHSRAEDDPVGHILRITPDFGRYTAVKYSAQDLAEMKGWSAEGNMLTGYGGGYQYGPVTTAAPQQPQQQRNTGDELVAELMQATQGADQNNLGVAVMEVFVRKDSEGNWQRQACVASPSGGPQQPAQNMPFASGMAPTLDIHVDNGVPGEDVIAMRISLGPSGQPSISDGNASTIEDMLKEMLSRGMEVPGGEVPEELKASMEQLKEAQGQGLMVFEEGGPSSADQSYQQSFERSPANLVRMDKDNFVLTVPGADPLSEGISPEQLQELEQDPHGDQQEHFDELRKALNMTGPTDSGVTSLVKPAPLRLPQPDEQQDKSSDGEKDESAQVDPWMKAAKEVKRLHKLNNPNTPLPMSGNELADVIKNAATGALEVLQQSYSMPNFCLEGSRVYSRIKQEEMPKTDPFSGLYLGSFGPHGPEILQLKRSVTESGEECVLGVKVTGDPNVPAGNVSFRARIGRKHRTSGWDVMYPPELDVQARYPGEGRVAQQGFKDAWWVEGELLHFGSNNPMIHGAELGFVWCVPNERRYLILLSRIDLDDARLNS